MRLPARLAGKCGPDAMTDFRACLDNRLDWSSGTPFAAIIGATPSKGARSPLLWNAAYEAFGRGTRMLPLDVGSERLTDLLAVLDSEPAFLGGAVALPHKEATAAWLGERLSPEAARIGAVNCLFRRNGRLWGTNTDGEGALVSLQAAVPDLATRKAALLGPGGAGKAVAAFLVGRVVSLDLFARTPDRSRAFAERLQVSVQAWTNLPELMSGYDLVVNCTSIGSAAADTAAQSPLGPQLVQTLPPTCFVYDIIYDPAESPLMRLAAQRGIGTLNGSAMNLEQAVLGFMHANPDLSDSTAVRQAMETARAKVG